MVNSFYLSLSRTLIIDFLASLLIVTTTKLVFCADLKEYTDGLKINTLGDINDESISITLLHQDRL